MKNLCLALLFTVSMAHASYNEGGSSVRHYATIVISTGLGCQQIADDVLKKKIGWAVVNTVSTLAPWAMLSDSKLKHVSALIAVANIGFVFGQQVKFGKPYPSEDYYTQHRDAIVGKGIGADGHSMRLWDYV